MRVAGYHVEHDGYMNDGLDNQDDSAGRLSFLLAPNDELSIRVVADYFDQGGLGTGSTPIALDPDNRYGISAAEGGAYYETQWHAIGRRNFNAMPLTQHLDNQFWGVNATLDWVTDAGTFTVLPAWRESHVDTEGAAIGTNVITIEDDQQEELRGAFRVQPGWPVQLHRRCVLLRREESRAAVRAQYAVHDVGAGLRHRRGKRGRIRRVDLPAH